MTKHLVKIVCWPHSHPNDLALTRKQADKLPEESRKGKKVCPTCKQEGLGNNPFAVILSVGMFSDPTLRKTYSCSKGHLTVVSAFIGGTLHCRYGPAHDDFFNIKGTPEELSTLVEQRQIFCHHEDSNGDRCELDIEARDNIVLSLPEGRNFRTVTRFGDLMDKAGMEPVRSGSYDEQGRYSESRTDKANRERLKNLKKTRLVDKDRSPGTPISKPSETIHRRRDKRTIDFGS